MAGSGLAGGFHTWRLPDRERHDSSLGVRRERVVYLAGRIIVQDENGNVRELRGILARRERTQRFVDSGAFVEHPESVKLVGATTLRGRAGYTLEVTAPDGEPETLIVDALTGLPLREQYIEGDGPLWVDVDEWREIKGHLFPWRSTVSDGEHAFDFTQTTERVRINGEIADDVFAPPVPRYLDLAAPVTVPIFESGAHFFCDVAIGKRTYRFLIDSGASGIVLDAHVAREQQLREEGALEVRGTTRSGGLHLVFVPNLQIGGAALHDLVATSLDLGTLRADGILGYPLFAAGLVRLDPVAKTMTLAAPDGLAPRGARLDIELDRTLPEAMVGVNGAVRAPFLLDTGNSTEVLLFRWFVELHPGLVPFTGEDRRSFGIGGIARSYRTVIDELEVAGTHLYQRDAAVVLETRGAFADRYDAGNVGLGVLRNFVVTFDEPHYAVYLDRAATFDDGRGRVLQRGNNAAISLPSRVP